MPLVEVGGHWANPCVVLRMWLDVDRERGGGLESRKLDVTSLDRRLARLIRFLLLLLVPNDLGDAFQSLRLDGGLQAIVCI